MKRVSLAFATRAAEGLQTGWVIYFVLTGGYLGLILKAPSSRITAPFSMGFS